MRGLRPDYRAARDAGLRQPVGRRDVLVDLTGLIDVAAEIARNEQQEKKLLGLIQSKEKKLANANFVDKAPAEVVQRERDGLAQLHEQLASVRAALAELRPRA